jgi:hypothetical protein
MNGGADDTISYFMPVDAIDVTILPPNASTSGVDAFRDRPTFTTIPFSSSCRVARLEMSHCEG